MINEIDYLNSINNYKNRGMEKDKIEKGIIADYRNRKITIETFDKAIKLLNEEKNNDKVITDLKTRIKVVTDPKEQREALENAKGHHKIDVLDIEDNER